jgi:hypothetical protein
MQRFQHAIPAGLIALVGLWVCFVSYTQTPAAAFAFPRLISTVFVVLALWTFFKALRDGAAQEGGFSRQEIARILPGLAVAAAYVFWGGQVLWVLHRNHPRLLYSTHLV